MAPKERRKISAEKTKKQRKRLDEIDIGKNPRTTAVFKNTNNVMTGTIKPHSNCDIYSSIEKKTNSVAKFFKHLYKDLKTKYLKETVKINELPEVFDLSKGPTLEETRERVTDSVVLRMIPLD